MNIRIHDIIKELTNSIPSRLNTVDRLLYGNPDSEVRGVAVTFLATHEVIEKAMSLGVNLIISHEGIFFSHRESYEESGSDPVFINKLKVIEDSKMAIYRFHDHIHDDRPDRIMIGLLESLGWQDYIEKEEHTLAILDLPELSLRQVITDIKERLGIGHVRFIGELEKTCRRTGVKVGYGGTGIQTIPLFEKEDIDLLIYGEGPEWETPEYMRDAVRQGGNRALIVLGHAESEAPGMEYQARLLKDKFPGIPIHFIPEKPVFHIF